MPPASLRFRRRHAGALSQRRGDCMAACRDAGACMTQIPPITFATRFRGFLPVVIDVETGGFNSQTDALLEIAAVFIEMRSDGTLARGETIRYHVVPFPGANMEPASLAVNGIDPHHPLRPAIPEEDALQRIFREVRNAIRAADCTRAVLVGHNCILRFEFLECRRGARPGQAQPVPSLLELRYRHLGRRGLRANGVDARDAGGGPGVGYRFRAFRRLRRRAHRRSFLHGVQSVSRGVRRQPPAPGLDGTAGDGALASERLLGPRLRTPDL